jgi:hypothetical protein
MVLTGLFHHHLRLKMIASFVVALLDAAILVGLHVLVSLKKLRKTAWRETEDTSDFLEREFGLGQQIAGNQAQILGDPIVHAQSRHAADGSIEMAYIGSHEPGIERYPALTIVANLPGKQVHVAVAARKIIKRHSRKTVALLGVDCCEAAVNGLRRNGRVLNRFHENHLEVFTRQVNILFNEIQYIYKIYSVLFNENAQSIKI